MASPQLVAEYYTQEEMVRYVVSMTVTSPGVFKVLHLNEKQPCESDIWKRSSEIAHGQLSTVCLLVISPTELSHTGVEFYL